MMAFNNKKKTGERFHPPFPPPPALFLEEYPMEFAPDLITVAHPEQEIKHEDQPPSSWTWYIWP